MGWLNQFKSNAALDRAAEEALYELAYKEVDSGQRRPGLWAKAIAKASGSEEKVKSLYIELLVQKYKDESHLREEIAKQKLREHVRAQQEAERKGAAEKEMYSRTKESESKRTSEQEANMWKPAISGDAVFWVVIAFVLAVVVLAVLFES